MLPQTVDVAIPVVGAFELQVFVLAALSGLDVAMLEYSWMAIDPSSTDHVVSISNITLYSQKTSFDPIEPEQQGTMTLKSELRFQRRVICLRGNEFVALN
jgi:hypothetical protein